MSLLDLLLFFYFSICIFHGLWIHLQLMHFEHHITFIYKNLLTAYMHLSKLRTCVSKAGLLRILAAAATGHIGRGRFMPFGMG